MILRILALPFLVAGVSALIFGAAVWQLARWGWDFARINIRAAVAWVRTGDTS